MDLLLGSARRLTEAYLAKEVSPVEIVRGYLARIDRHDQRLRSIVTLAREAALDAAGVAERAYLAGENLGPLTGVPIALKDSEATAGIRTTHGSRVFENHVPERDSLVAERLKAAGAILLAKTNLPELGMGSESESPRAGYSLNPWHPGRTSGGSSGGSAAAVAAAFASAATGSDAAGSIVTPAAFCGVFGLKPTRGRIAHWPPPNTWPSFLEAGPMTRFVADADLLLRVLAGPDPRAPRAPALPASDLDAAPARRLSGLRAAWTTHMGYGRSGAEAEAAARRLLGTLADLGVAVEEAHPAVSSPFGTWTTIARVEEFAAWGLLLATRPECLTQGMRARLRAGEALSPAAYAAARQAAEDFRQAFHRFFQDFDLLLAPTNAVGAFPPGQPPASIGGAAVKPDWEGFTPFPLCANLTGYPVATLPSGLTREGLPLGLMIIARPRAEALLLAVSAALEAAHPWLRTAPLAETIASPAPDADPDPNPDNRS